MARSILSILAVFLVTVAPPAVQAAESGRWGLSVVVDGTALAEYPHRDRVYIEAFRGRSFSLRISNPTSERVAVAVSVDGLNVVDAKRTSAGEAAKWVIWPGQTIEIPGWQVSGETSRRFFFTETGRSYAKWIGDTRNVGTIEAVFFRERIRPLTIVGGVAETRPARANDPVEQESAGRSEEGQVRRKSQRDARPAPSAVAPGPEPPRAADRFAATGIGERTRFPVRWIDFDEDPSPVARIRLRYEFRPELARLGVLAGEEDLYGRERGRGFEREYAPDPGGDR
jgi:hypothetical protein